MWAWVWVWMWVWGKGWGVGRLRVSRLPCCGEVEEAREEGLLRRANA